ncbi:endonuclease domain-containing 1 protein-like [Ictalurus furcatus]|uniref:endonuclease domain-containing 1 protein-like n=1 Tax=Ictalurus furcatus TaxID=66913 RepID=UPI002350115C|nr:endonuclease domain-containing 1 protein-like [Ictalurus furcatus]
MKLLSVVLLLLPLSICLAEVVNDFTESCPGFFANPNHVVSPPTGFSGNRFRQICQTRNNQAEFATLYDTENRIPVYSAYRFTKLMGCKRNDKNKWYIEPQLEDGNLWPNMSTESAVRKQGVRIVNQAVNADYSGSRLHKGHLAPVLHANSQECADATFTLTNAAPQNPSFNSGKWKVTEREMAYVLNTDCTDEGLRAFVVTGVVPGNNIMNNKVRIPSHFWTAFCCLDNNNQTNCSGAYIGENSNDFAPYRKSVLDVETELTQLYGEHFRNIIPFKFQFFDGKCYTETERARKRKKSGCETNKRQKL